MEERKLTGWQKVWIALGVAALLVLAMLLGACLPPDQPDLRPAPCATWQAPDGTWMEEDNEPVDGDPCDRLPDVKKTTKAPTVVKTTKPAVKAPAPRITRR